MSTVESWFDDFVTLLTGNLRRSDWPNFQTPAGRNWWDLFRSRMVHHGMRWEEVEVACQMLFDAPPAYLDHVWPEFLAAVNTHREAKRPGALPDDRESARAASRGCPYCQGAGLVTVYLTRPGDLTQRHPPSLSAVCTCAFGRWHRAAVQKSTPDRKARMIDLESVLNGSVAYRLRPIDSPGWESEAEAHWKTLSESEREEARATVRDCLNEFVQNRPAWVEGIAKGWSYDPPTLPRPPWSDRLAANNR